MFSAKKLEADRVMVAVSSLSGSGLDWAVALAEGYKPIKHTHLATIMLERVNLRGVMEPIHLTSIRYSISWLLAGPIIAREKIAVRPEGDLWIASALTSEGEHIEAKGDSLIVAALRCFVEKETGSTFVEVPNFSTASTL